MYKWVCNIPVSDIESCKGASGIPVELNKFIPYSPKWNQPTKPWIDHNNINDWQLFRQRSDLPNYDQCLSGNVEMPHNEYEMGKIIEAHIAQLSKVPPNIWVGSNEFEFSPQALTVIFHNMVIQYATAVSTNDDPIEIPDPCCD